MDEAALSKLAYCVESRLHVALSDSDHFSAGVASASMRSMVIMVLKVLLLLLKVVSRLSGG